jgi:hypothetical protein
MDVGDWMPFQLHSPFRLLSYKNVTAVEVHSLSHGLKRPSITHPSAFCILNRSTGLTRTGLGLSGHFPFCLLLVCTDRFW